MNFAVECAWKHLKAGRHFYIENSYNSVAWRIVDKLVKLGADKRVHWCRFDQCMLGKVNASGEPQMKPTSGLTSCQELAEALDSYRCDRTHQHSPPDVKSRR